MKVKFWPKGTIIPAVICNHRFDAVMTYSHQTDTRYESSIYAGELYGFKNNVRLGAFSTNIGDYYTEGIAGAQETGLMNHDIYFMTDYWKNPTTGVVEVIPDYYATAYTAAGAAVFANAVVGAAKTARQPNHGAQMYTISNGAYGYNPTTGVSGANNQQELIGVIEDMQNWLESLTGRKPSSFSFRNGENGSQAQQLPFWLGGRVSSTGNPNTVDADTRYGNNLGFPALPAARFDFIHYANTDRFSDYPTFTQEQVDAYVRTQMQKTLANHGWYRSFAHWHTLKADGKMADLGRYLGIIREEAGSNFIWTCGNGEALEYMFLRELASRSTVQQNGNRLHVIVDVVDKYKAVNNFGITNKVPLIQFNTPLSVKVDLTGTVLAGKQVKSSFSKVRNLGNNQYIVEVPYHSDEERFAVVELLEGTGGAFNTARPTGTALISNGVITVTTNMPVKVAVFAVTAGGSEYNSLIYARSNELKSIHTIPVISGNDYRVGIISEFGQANLITV